MIDKFLKAKHWQLFLLTFGIPMIFQIFFMGSIFVNIASGIDRDPSFIINYMKFFPGIIFLFMGVLFGWLWSVAIGLQSKVPDVVQMKVNKFKIFFFIPFIYSLFFLSFFMSSFTEGRPNPSIFAVIVPLHIFSMFCMFYILYFVSKTYKTVELQREVKFSDFAGEFFMIWFYPIGIWIVQPKINKMIE